MSNNINVKKLVVILLIIALGSLTIAGAILAKKGPKEIFETGTSNTIDDQKSFSMDGIKGVDIKTVSTDINIIPSDSNEIKAHFHGSITATENNIPYMEADINGSKVDISIKQKSKFSIGLNLNFGKIVLDVYVPKAYINAVNIDTTSGDADIKGLTFEQLDFNSVSGDLYASSLNTKDTTLRTTSGDTKMENFSGNLNHTSVSGDIKIEYSAFNNNVSIHSTSGDTELSIPENSQFNLTFSSTSGDFTNKYGTIESSMDNKHNFSASTGYTSNKIKVSTVSGDFKITK